MNPTLQNVLAFVGAALIGMLVNMSLVYLGPSIIALPEGADMTTPEGIKAAMPLLELKHFIFPFLAHALGTLAGAFAVAKLAASNKKYLALAIGGFFLLGGIYMVTLVGGPLWFTVLDLVGAYIPMGWLGWNLATKKS